MNNPQQRLALKRKVFLKSQPQIKLKTCRLERSKESDIHRLIIEGNPVLLGAVLPKIEIGGLVPLKMMASTDGKLAVGIVKGHQKNNRVLIDYGFTRDHCEIEEASFTEKDVMVFKQITQIPVRRARGNKLWRMIRKFLARIFLKRKDLNQNK